MKTSHRFLRIAVVAAFLVFVGQFTASAGRLITRQEGEGESAFSRFLQQGQTDGAFWAKVGTVCVVAFGLTFLVVRFVRFRRQQKKFKKTDLQP